MIESKLAGAGVDVVTINPGPVFTGLGQEHVPLLVYPSYALMKLLLFPPALKAAMPLVALSLGAPYPSGTYLHIREDHTARWVARWGGIV
jgi:hypothetical protein